jgi:hypothetical protein
MASALTDANVGFSRCARFSYWIAPMIQTILIGPPKTSPNPQSGIGLFIQSVLRYPALLLRLAVAAIAWGALKWLGWTIPAGVGFLVLEIYTSLLVLRMFTDLLAYRQLGLILKAMWNRGHSRRGLPVVLQRPGARAWHRPYGPAQKGRPGPKGSPGQKGPLFGSCPCLLGL